MEVREQYSLGDVDEDLVEHTSLVGATGPFVSGASNANSVCGFIAGDRASDPANILG